MVVLWEEEVPFLQAVHAAVAAAVGVAPVEVAAAVRPSLPQPEQLPPPLAALSSSCLR